jgi:hypothetical protein
MFAVLYDASTRHWRRSVRDQQAGRSRDRQDQIITEFATRLGVVKGYAQLLNRHVDREDISRARLARYSRALEQQIVLLEAAAHQLIGDIEEDAVLDESILLSHADLNDSGSTAAT